MNETELFTPREFAAYRRCSVRTLDRERADGTGCPYIRISGRILYLRADVNRFIDAHRIGTSESSEGEPYSPRGALERYLPNLADQAVTPSQSPNDGHFDDFVSVTAPDDVTVQKSQKPKAFKGYMRLLLTLLLTKKAWEAC